MAFTSWVRDFTSLSRRASRQRSIRKPKRGKRPGSYKLALEPLEQRLASAINVAVVTTGGAADDSGFFAIVNQLNNDTIFDFQANPVTAAAVDTIAELNNYNTVVLGSIATTTIPFNNTTFIDALRSWVQNGGGVVTTGRGLWGAFSEVSTRAKVDDIVPVSLQSGVVNIPGSAGVLIVNGGHPVSSGVANFSTASSIESTSTSSPDPGATLLGITSGRPTVVTGSFGAGKSVYLGPHYSVGAGTSDLRIGNPDRVLEQAVAWAAKLPPPNQPPFANNDNYGVSEDNSLVVGPPGVLVNDFDPDGGPLTAVLVSPTPSGLSFNPNGSFTYTPSPNFNGVVSFTYQAKDAGGLTSNVATVTITVSPVNDPPVAANDTVTTNEDSPVVIPVLANDADPDGDALTPVLQVGPQHGLVVINPDKTITYTPAGDYFGPDSFTYVAKDGSLSSNLATVSITVESVNDAPIAQDDSAVTDEDMPVTIAVLANDSAGPPNESSQTLTITHLNGVAVGAGDTVGTPHGSVTLNADGTVTYTPALDYNGPDSCSYTIRDSGSPPLSDSANGSVTINPVNDRPVARDDFFGGLEDTTLTIAAPGILANDTDADGNPLTVGTPRPISAPTRGILTLNADGSFTYTPFANYFGPDSFTYMANDGVAYSNLATVTIDIRPLNDPPRADNDSAITDKDRPVLIRILTNDRDPDGFLDPRSVRITLPPRGGSLSIDPGTGDVTYTPFPGFSGPDTFRYQVSDNEGASSNEAQVDIFVNAVNSPPRTNDDHYSTPQDQPLSVPEPGVLANDTDPDGDRLRLRLASPATNGTVILRPDGSFDYFPNAGYSGPDSFSYEINDGFYAGIVATVFIDVVPVNDPPVITVDQDTVEVDEGEVAYNHGTYGDVDLGDSVTLSASLGTVVANSDGTWDWSYQTTDGPLPDGFTIEMIAMDLAGVTASVTFGLQVNNVAPSNLQLNSGSITEGSAFTLTGSFDDPGTADEHTVTITWEPGDVQVVVLPVGARSFSVDRWYPDDDPSGTPSDVYPISVNVADDDGGAVSGDTSVTVDNVAPQSLRISIGIILPAEPEPPPKEAPPEGEEPAKKAPAEPIPSKGNSGPEGTTFLVSGSFFDFGPRDSFTVTISWGPDEGTTTLLVPSQKGFYTFEATHQYLDDNPSGSSADFYPITVTVVDDDGGEAFAETGVTVTNVDPVIGVLSKGAINENETFTVAGSFDDPGTLDEHTVTVTWSEGSASVTLPVGDRNFSVDIPFPDDNPSGTPSDTYVISVVITDDDNGIGLAETSVVVNNVAPSNLALNAGDINEHDHFVLTGSFADPGVLDEHTVVIDWGSGESSEVITLEVGQRDFAAAHPYHLPGTYSVTVTVLDDDGGAVAGATSVVVHNIGPSSLALNGGAINENDVFILTGSFDDPSVQDVHTLLIDWGPGEGSDTLVLGPGERSFSAGHQYRDDNPSGTSVDFYPVSVTVIDSYGAGVRSGTPVFVHNVAPANLVLNGGATFEGSVFTLTGSFDDPGMVDVHTVTVTWSEGSASFTLAPGDHTFSFDIPFPDDNPTETPADAYSISVTVTDDDGGQGVAETAVLVNNAPPSNLVLNSGSINENDTFTLTGSFFDPGTLDEHTVTVDWGPGEGTETFLLPAGQGAFKFSHQYLDDNPTGTPADKYVISVTVADDDGGMIAAETSVAVSNIAPRLDGMKPQVINENDVVILSSTIFDPGTLDTFKLVVDWGDPLSPNNIETHTFVAGPKGTPFTLSHRYLDDNPSGSPVDTYTVTLSLTDDDDIKSVFTASTKVTVNDVAPQLANLAATDTDENGVATFKGTIVDPGTLDTFTMTVDWGDPLSPNNIETYTFGPSATGSQGFFLTHQYLDDNPTGTPSDSYAVFASVADDDKMGTKPPTIPSLTVTNVAPTLSDLAAWPIYESGVTTLTGVISDPGTLDTFTLTVDWGDPLSPDNIETYTFGASPTGSQSFALTHLYLDHAPTSGVTHTYTINLTVVDDDTGVGTGSVDVTIHNLVDLSGRVFDDRDNDGAFHGTDTGLSNVTLNLFNELDLFTPVATTTTDGLGNYAFDANLLPGTYRIVEAQPAGYLDGKETAGALGGAVDNSQDSNVIGTIIVAADAPDAGGYDFAEIRPSRLQGMVWEDSTNDGEVDFGELPIANVMIQLTGIDDRGNAVNLAMPTDTQGIFEFTDLRPSGSGGYTLTEIQPASHIDGKEHLGTVNGVLSGVAVDNVFSQIALSLPGSDGINYNFGELLRAGAPVEPGQTATIGFWQNKNGQDLIKALNGGSTSTQLSNWLATNFPNMYGASAGANNLTGKTNAQIAAFYVTLFKKTGGADGPPKLDAQVLATALAVYVTNQSLAGTTAAAFGFNVTATGLGAATFDVGNANRAAFGLSATQSTVMTVFDILLATNALARNGVLYDTDSSGTISSSEKALRVMANNVFTGINEQGDI